MTDLELLRGIRELIGVPERWTQNTAARNSNGTPVPVRSDCAVRFCPYGAAAKLLDAPATVLLDRLPKTLGVTSVITFNDTHTHAEVIALLDRRIAELEAA